jgi:enoyl-CoA hydratase
MTNSLILNRHDNGVAVLTFNRPQALNALNRAMMQRFAETMQQLSTDDTLRVLLVTGAGERAFCSGGDLHELAEHPTEDDARDFITLMGDALLQMERLPVPVIAAMNGYALGGGSEIALACDIRIVDEQIKMGMVQINMALTPGWGAGQRLLRLVGYSRAMELLLRGDVLRADDVKAFGLANDVVDAGQALPAALVFAREIAKRPPRVVRGIKSLLQAGWHQPYDEALHTERELFPPLWADDPHLNAVAKFLARQRERNEE